MADSNISGQQAFQQASGDIDKTTINQASKAIETPEIEQEPVQENEPQEQETVAPVSQKAETLEQIEEEPQETPVNWGGMSFTERANQAIESGEVEYPTFRTLSQEQKTSYESIKNNPVYQKLARRAYHKETGEYLPDEAAVRIADMIDKNKELPFGNLELYKETPELKSMILNSPEAQEIIEKAIRIEGTENQYNFFSRLIDEFKRENIGDFTMAELRVNLGDTLVALGSPDIKESAGAITTVGAGVLGATKGATLGTSVAGPLGGAVGGVIGGTAGAIGASKGFKAIFGKNEIEKFADQRQEVYKRFTNKEITPEQAEKELVDIRKEENKYLGKLGEDTVVQTIGKELIRSGMDSLEKQASQMPSLQKSEQEGWAGFERKVVGGVNSMGTLLLEGMIGKKTIGNSIASKKLKAKVDSLPEGREISQAVKNRYKEQVSGKIGSDIARGSMALDITGQAAVEDIQTYIERTGDKDLNYYQGDISKVALNLASAYVQDVIEQKWGVTKFIKNPRVATKWSEWANGFVQEFTQGEITDITEWTKGNQDFQEVLQNVWNNIQDGLVGGLTQGALGTSVYYYNHNKAVNDLSDALQGFAPNKSKKEIREFADKKITELEEESAVDMVNDIVDFADATTDQGKIYNTVKTAITKAINDQREKMKDTIDGSKFDYMSEDELAQHIESVTQDEMDKIVIESLENGIPLSESPRLKGITIDGTYYIEGADYAKRTAEEERQNRERIKEIVFAQKQAEKDAKTAALIADGRIKAREKRQKEESARQTREAKQREIMQQRLEKELQRTSKLVEKQEKELAKQEAQKVQSEKSQTVKNIRGGNIAIISEILSKNGFRTRDLSGTATKELAVLNWTLFKNTDLGVSARRGEIQTTLKAIDRNVESGNDVLLRSGLTQEQIDKMDDTTWNNAVIEAYKKENQEKIQEEEKELTEEQLSEIPDDLAFQEQFDLANKNARLDDIYPEYTGETINIDGKERSVYNSNGERIAKSEQALRNFYKWFGDSKVVDEQGRPLVVYHGTGVRFEEFDNVFGRRGIYFTDSKIVASSYQGVNGGRETITMPVYVKVGNPFVIDFDGNNYADVPQIVENYKFDDLDDVVSWAKTKGYDGVIAKNIKDPSNTSASWEAMRTIANDYVAFESNQIKSINNRGTYDIESPNIYYQSAYAGSRVDYDRPSLEAIGSGEGNQAHGWGLYYALNPEIADRYRQDFVAYEQPIEYKNKKYEYGKDLEYTPLQRILDGDSVESIIKDYESSNQGIRESLLSAQTTWGQSLWAENMEHNDKVLDFLKTITEKDIKDIKNVRGQVHEVDIPETDVLLDENIGYEFQPDFVKTALKNMVEKENLKYEVLTNLDNNYTGKQIYNALAAELGNPKDASQMLEKYGIKGITYEGGLDGRCFVIFNPKDVKVLRKKFDELGNVLFQDRQSGKGGAYDSTTRSITLGGKADATTLPHELAHYWIDKNFKWARSGKASQEWKRQWDMVEKWLGIDPEDKFLSRQASEKFARAYEKFLGTEKAPLVLSKSFGDFRDFVLDHYDYDLDEATGLQDAFGRPIQLNDDVKNWFRKSVYDSYSNPTEKIIVNQRIKEDEKESIIAGTEINNTENESIQVANEIIDSSPIKTEEIAVINKRTFGGGEEKESKGKIASQLNKTYESTSWEIQERLVEDYLNKVSLDEALDNLYNETYPEKIDPNFLRQALSNKLLDANREEEAIALIEETAESFTMAAQQLQSARRLTTPFTETITQLTQRKAERLARAKFGKWKSLEKLDKRFDELVAKYETMFVNAKTDEERQAVFDAMQAEAVRTIGTLNKSKDTGLLFQDDEKQARQELKAIKQAQKRRSSIAMYRAKAKRLLKEATGLTPTKEQVKNIRKMSADVNKAINQYRKSIRENKASAIDPTPVLEEMNKLNNYLNSNVGESKLSKFADATNSFASANMLWNVATNAFNVWSTWVQMIPHMLANKINNKESSISWDVKRKIIQNALKIQLKTGYNIFSLQDFMSNKTIWAEKYYEATSTLGKGIRAPLTALGLMDTMNKGVVFLDTLDRLATARAKETGKNAEDLFYQGLNTDPRTISVDGLKIRQQAVLEGEEATFTQSTDLAKAVNTVRKVLNLGYKTGFGNFLMPFTTTIANIADDAIKNYALGSVRSILLNPKSFINALNPKLDAEFRKEEWKKVKPQTKNVLKNIIGITILLSLALKDGDDDDFVLDYSNSTEIDKDIRQNRNAPSEFAVRIGDKWVSLELFGIGSIFAKMYLVAKRHAFTTDGWVRSGKAMIDLIPGISEINDLLKAIDDPLKGKTLSERITNYFDESSSELLTRMIPASALLNQIGNIEDTTKRETWNKWYDRAIGKIPFARRLLPERLSSKTGEVLKQTDTIANLISGQRLKDYVPATPADKARYEFYIAGQGLNYKEGASKLKELGKDTPEFKKAVAEVRKDFTKALGQVANNPQYQTLDIDEKKKLVNKLHTESLEKIKIKYGVAKKKKSSKNNK